VLRPPVEATAESRSADGLLSKHYTCAFAFGVSRAAEELLAGLSVRSLSHVCIAPRALSNVVLAHSDLGFYMLHMITSRLTVILQAAADKAIFK
jgi:hypothetical protein